MLVNKYIAYAPIVYVDMKMFECFNRLTALSATYQQPLSLSCNAEPLFFYFNW